MTGLDVLLDDLAPEHDTDREWRACVRVLLEAASLPAFVSSPRTVRNRFRAIVKTTREVPSGARLGVLLAALSGEPEVQQAEAEAVAVVSTILCANARTAGVEEDRDPVVLVARLVLSRLANRGAAWYFAEPRSSGGRIWDIGHETPDVTPVLEALPSSGVVLCGLNRDGCTEPLFARATLRAWARKLAESIDTAHAAAPTSAPAPAPSISEPAPTLAALLAAFVHERSVPPLLTPAEVATVLRCDRSSLPKRRGFPKATRRAGANKGAATFYELNKELLEAFAGDPKTDRAALSALLKRKGWIGSA